MIRITMAAIALTLTWASAAAAQAASASPHGKLRLEIDCTACHSTGAWKPMRDRPDFDHGKQAGFALSGKHASVGCASCHSGLRYDKPRARVNECASCHVDVHQGRLGANCSSCHGTDSFTRAADSGQHARTAFPLTGAHAQVPCASCHRGEQNGEYTRLESTCASCHRADYSAARAPDHAAAAFPVDCQQCHSTARWSDAAFDHTALGKGFVLEGAHAAVRCTACHAGAGFKASVSAASSNCVTCHRADYDREHKGTGFSTSCTTCHTTARWGGARFDHAAVGHGFALSGVHSLPCASCHAPDNSLIFPAPTAPTDCVACHRADYDRQHTGTGFSTTCTTCHSTGSWKGAVFDHAANARGFALVGAHIRATCGACHAPPDGKVRFSAANQNDCIACHRTDYDGKHLNTTIPTTCLSCHNVERWTGATYTHDRFPLTGVHALPCASCHAPDNKLIFPTPTAPTDCVACHRADYDRQHAGSAYPTTCTSCHTSASWTGATFDHAIASAGYVLVGVHAAKACSSCHAADGTSIFNPANNNDCASCHKPDYDRAHTGTGYPLTCASCHPQTTWTAATFDHDRQFFPIYSGKHQGKWSNCAQCHPTSTSLSVFTCTTSCHSRTKTDGDHSGVANYAYDSVRCLACHPRGN